MTPSQALRTLGLSTGATVEDIKRAQRRLQLLYHPDRHHSADDATRDDVLAKSKEINAAASLLLESLDGNVGDGDEHRTEEGHSDPWEWTDEDFVDDASPEPEEFIDLLGELLAAEMQEDWHHVIRIAATMRINGQYCSRVACIAARAFMSEGQRAGALKAVQDAIELDPTSHQVWFSAAKVHAFRGETRLALEALSRATKIAGKVLPDHAELERELLRSSWIPRTRVEEPIFATRQVDDVGPRFFPECPLLAKGLIPAAVGVASLVLLIAGWDWLSNVARNGSVAVLIIASILSLRHLANPRLPASSKATVFAMLLAAISGALFVLSYASYTHDRPVAAVASGMAGGAVLVVDLFVAARSMRRWLS